MKYELTHTTYTKQKPHFQPKIVFFFRQNSMYFKFQIIAVVQLTVVEMGTNQQISSELLIIIIFIFRLPGR